MASEEEYLAYMERLAEDEIAGVRQPIAFGPYTAMVVIGALQLATRNPSMDDRMRALLSSVVEQFRPWFAGTLGEHLIDQGNDPERDR
jgi:hypothetical protein